MFLVHYKEWERIQSEGMIYNEMESNVNIYLKSFFIIF